MWRRARLSSVRPMRERPTNASCGASSGKAEYKGKTINAGALRRERPGGFVYGGAAQRRLANLSRRFRNANAGVDRSTPARCFSVPKTDQSLFVVHFSDVTIDLSECTNYDNKGTSTIGATSGDLDGLGTGRRLGDMIGVSIQKDGMIYASYDNGMTKLLGQIATAAFANASGLEKEGDNLYSATLNSGEFDGIGVDITAGGGYMSTGQLEMSNVDLSSEFTEMITTQRGFQANSRIITVSDTLLEELTNLKR